MSKISISESQITLLERLSNAVAVSGDEGEVRKIVLEEARPLADEVKVDALGNVLVTRHGRAMERRLRLMLDAHMDEVGFMITKDDGDGIFRFDTVGGIDVRQLVAKPVWVGSDHVPGVIGAKPIHLSQPDERKKAVALDALRIDVGLGGSKVKVGDRATFATRFARLGNDAGRPVSVCGKALDDRLGVTILIELLRQAPDNVDLCLAFTVQEENGLRGAQVAAYAFNPDAAIAVDSTPALDLPAWDGSENTQYNTRLGAGPAIYVADTGTLSDPRLIHHLAETGDQLGIPYQLRQPGGGGDAAAIHKQRSGIPSITVSVPGRYAHTAAGLTRFSDWEHSLALLHAAIGTLTPEIFNADR
jgi:tetrahedral aminopeptidase